MIDPFDAHALAVTLRAIGAEIGGLETDVILRAEFFQGRPIRFPLPTGDDGHKWVELRLIDVAEVVSDAVS